MKDEEERPPYMMMAQYRSKLMGRWLMFYQNLSSRKKAYQTKSINALDKLSPIYHKTKISSHLTFTQAKSNQTYRPTAPLVYTTKL